VDREAYPWWTQYRTLCAPILVRLFCGAKLATYEGLTGQRCRSSKGANMGLITCNMQQLRLLTKSEKIGNPPDRVMCRPDWTR
jgi:hypothetical protein